MQKAASTKLGSSCGQWAAGRQDALVQASALSAWALRVQGLPLTMSCLQSLGMELLPAAQGHWSRPHLLYLELNQGQAGFLSSCLTGHQHSEPMGTHTGSQRVRGECVSLVIVAGECRCSGDPTTFTLAASFDRQMGPGVSCVPSQPLKAECWSFKPKRCPLLRFSTAMGHS